MKGLIYQFTNGQQAKMYSNRKNIIKRQRFNFIRNHKRNIIYSGDKLAVKGILNLNIRYVNPLD